MKGHGRIPLDVQIEMAGLAKPEREYRFWPGRRFRFDLAWPDLMLAFEIEGGVFGHSRAPTCPNCGQKPRGAHSSVTGILRDIEKYNEAMLRGWMVQRVLPQDVHTGVALNKVERAIITIQLRSNDALPQMTEMGNPTAGIFSPEVRNDKIRRLRTLTMKLKKLG
jgi:hypothetical protein